MSGAIPLLPLYTFMTWTGTLEVCEGFIFVTLCLNYISILVYTRPHLQILLEYKLISKNGNCSYSKFSNLFSTGVYVLFRVRIFP